GPIAGAAPGRLRSARRQPATGPARPRGAGRGALSRREDHGFGRLRCREDRPLRARAGPGRCLRRRIVAVRRALRLRGGRGDGGRTEGGKTGPLVPSQPAVGARGVKPAIKKWTLRIKNSRHTVTLRQTSNAKAGRQSARLTNS